jgi:hypothetical protein
MLMNLLALLVLSLIVFCGIWLADSLSQRPKDQGCMPLSGTYCLPVPVISSAR